MIERLNRPFDQSLTAQSSTDRIAVVLFNLGGPDRLSAIQPFLFNLFSDPAIIRLPRLLRWLLAKFLARRRVSNATEIYRQIGGKSPLLELTKAQAQALALELGAPDSGSLDTIKVFVAMRYWHPMIETVVQEVKDFSPDHVILLPLYPQFSSTTTGSAMGAWRSAALRRGLDAPSSMVCCYPDQAAFLDAHVQLIRTALTSDPAAAPLRLLFSAHGLPEKIVAAGDPYQWQVERTVQGIVAHLGTHAVDHVVCYQSRVGPMRWIGPSTKDELKRAAADGVNVMVVPVAFVSEHSETLVELDIEYRDLARSLGIEHYLRVPALGVETNFIAGLAAMVRACKQDRLSLKCFGAATCPAEYRDCPWRGTGQGPEARGLMTEC